MKLGPLDLSKLRQRDLALICIALTVAAAVLWYFYMYKPTLDEASELETRVETLGLQVQRGEAARDNLPNLRNEVAMLELEREVFLSELPTESEVAALLDEVRLAATDTDVVLDSISQGNANEAIQEVRPIGFNLSTTGTFGETMSFLDTLEDLQRFTKVRQVGYSVSSEGGNDPDLSANYAFTVYVFTGNDPGAE